MPEETKKRFEEKFGGSMKWIKLNCKNEIIDGVSIDNIELDLLSFIESECQRREGEDIKKYRGNLVLRILSAKQPVAENENHLSPNYQYNLGLLEGSCAVSNYFDSLTNQSITKI